MLIVLFFKCITALLNPIYRRGESIKLGLVSYTVVMFSLATVFTAMNLDLESIAYIDNPNFTGITGVEKPGPLGYLDFIYLKTINVVPNVAFVVSNWLGDGFLVSSLFNVVSTRPGAHPFESALSLLRDPFHEPLGHRISLPHIPQFCECIFSLPRTAVTLKANVDKVVMGVLAVISNWEGAMSYIPFFSISVSLNVTLTLMIVLRLVLHGRCIRAATGSRAGIGGLYKTIATMFIESCALFAMSSLFLVGSMTAKNGEASSLAAPILGEIQVRAFPDPQFFDGSSHVMMEWTDHCSTAHHSTSRQQERVDKHHYPRKCRFQN